MVGNGGSKGGGCHRLEIARRKGSHRQSASQTIWREPPVASAGTWPRAQLGGNPGWCPNQRPRRRARRGTTAFLYGVCGAGSTADHRVLGPKVHDTVSVAFCLPLQLMYATLASTEAPIHNTMPSIHYLHSRSCISRWPGPDGVLSESRMCTVERRPSFSHRTTSNASRTLGPGEDGHGSWERHSI